MLSTSVLGASLILALSPTRPPLANTLAYGAFAPTEEVDEDAEADDVEDEAVEEAVEDEAVEDEAVEDEAVEDEAVEDGGDDNDPPEPRGPGAITVPSSKGTGLMITAGVLGGVAAAVMGWRVARIQRFCSGDSLDEMTVSEENIDAVVADAAECFIAGRGVNAALWVLQAGPNAATFGLAPAAAMKRAKHDAALSLKTGEVSRKSGAFIGAGAALLGLGAAGRVVVAVLRIRSFNLLQGVAANCLLDGTRPTEEFFGCYADRNSLLYGMHQLTSASVATGAGLLTYGLVYQKERKSISTVYGLQETSSFELSVQPQLSFNYTGASLAMRF